MMAGAPAAILICEIHQCVHLSGFAQLCLLFATNDPLRGSPDTCHSLVGRRVYQFFKERLVEFHPTSWQPRSWCLTFFLFLLGGAGPIEAEVPFLQAPPLLPHSFPTAAHETRRPALQELYLARSVGVQMDTFRSGVPSGCRLLSAQPHMPSFTLRTLPLMSRPRAFLSRRCR